MNITIVGFPGIPQRVAGMVDAASSALASLGFDVVRTDVPALGLPDTISAEDLATWNAFTLTPGSLIESWRVARHLDALVEPGAKVLIVDHQGKGGMFALEQAMRGDDDARDVWTLAGAARVLEELDTFAVAVGSDGETAAAIDWELVQYRFSARVIALGERTRSLLDSIGIRADLLPLPIVPSPQDRDLSGEYIAVPEPVARRSHTPEIMRAVVDALAGEPTLTACISQDGDEDIVWAGTTWDTIPIPDSVAGRIERLSNPAASATMVVLGDVFAVPSRQVAEAYERGATVIVPRSSVAASTMPHAREWEGEEQLATVIRLQENSDRRPHVSEPFGMATHEDPSVEERSRRVSVGIPVYADTRFLDECVASVVGQTQMPHEVILFDDGSHDKGVTESLDTIASEHPGLVRVMRGPNRGVCVARNEMIAAMTGDAFVLVDSDDMLHLEFIATCAQALQANPEVSAVATWTEFFGGYNGIEAKPPFTARVGLRENPIVSTAALIDIKVIEDGIAFVDDLAFLYCEDWHLWSQIVASGGRFGLIPRPLVRHRVHGSSGATRRTELAHRVGKYRATEPLVGGWPL